MARGQLADAAKGAAEGADTDPAAERLRLRYPPPGLPRPAAFAIVALVGAVFVAWVVWAGIVQATPGVSGRMATFTIVSDTQVRYTLTVDRRDPSVPVHCRVIAQATNFERVGSVDLLVPAHQARLVDVTETMKTYRRATSVSLDSCWIG